MDQKLTLIKRRLQLGRRAQLRRRVHHQCRPCQCSRQGPATGGRDEQGDTSCVTLQDRRRFIHLKLETDEQGDHGRSTLIPVLQEAEFSRRGPQIEAAMNSLEARRLLFWLGSGQTCASCTTRKRGLHRATKAPRARRHVRAGGAECRQGELHPTAAQEHKEAQFRSAANGPGSDGPAAKRACMAGAGGGFVAPPPASTFTPKVWPAIRSVFWMPYVRAATIRANANPM